MEAFAGKDFERGLDDFAAAQIGEDLLARGEAGVFLRRFRDGHSCPKLTRLVLCL